MINREVPHQVLHDLGASKVWSLGGNTYYEPANLDISGLAVAELSHAKKSRGADLVAVFNTEVAKGFTSSALGTAHTYKTPTLEHQVNMAGAGAATVSVAVTCTDSLGVEAQRTHTSAQLQTMINDAAVHKSGLVSHLRERLGQVAAATTIDQVQAVTW